MSDKRREAARWLASAINNAAITSPGAQIQETTAALYALAGLDEPKGEGVRGMLPSEADYDRVCREMAEARRLEAEYRKDANEANGRCYQMSRRAEKAEAKVRELETIGSANSIKRDRDRLAAELADARRQLRVHGVIVAERDRLAATIERVRAIQKEADSCINPGHGCSDVARKLDRALTDPAEEGK